MVNQAQQLYILRRSDSWPRPQMLRPPGPNPNAGGSAPIVCITPGDWINSPTSLGKYRKCDRRPRTAAVNRQRHNHDAAAPSSFGCGTATLLFCIPPNGQLLAYWDTVSQLVSIISVAAEIFRASRSRCLLYAPPIELRSFSLRGRAVEAVSPAARRSPRSTVSRYICRKQSNSPAMFVLTAHSFYRLSKKKDAEALSVLRANQELDIQTLNP